MTSTLRRAALAVLLCALAPAMAHAHRIAKPALTDAQKAELQTRYQHGALHYNKGEWAQAIDEFKVCYEMYPDPSFLFNIAQAYRQAGQDEIALGYYEQYIDEADEDHGVNVPEAKVFARQLRKKLGQPEAGGPSVAAAPVPAAPPAPPPAPATPATRAAAVVPVHPAPAAPAPAGADLSASAPPSSARAARDDRSSPLYRSVWFWSGVGAAAVAAVAISALELSGTQTRVPSYACGGQGASCLGSQGIQF